MKSLWVKISYFWFIVMLFIVGLLTDNLIVKASAYQDWTSSQSRYRYDDHGTNTYSAWETTPHTWEPTLPVNKIQWRVKYSEGLSYENTYIIKFAYRPIPQAVTPTRIQVYADTGTIVYENITCGQWAYNGDNFNVVQCSFTPKNNISASTWLIIEVNLTEGYLTSLRTYMNQFEERTGTNAVITQTGDKITNEITNLEQTIINNNQTLIDTITENSTTCENVSINMNLSNLSCGYMLSSNGTIGRNSSYCLTKYYKIKSSSQINALRAISYYSCFYNENKELISCFRGTSSNSTAITIPASANYVRFSLMKQRYDYYTLNQCKSNTDSTNDKIEDLNDTISSDEVDSPDSSLQEMQDMLPTNGTITQLIALPLSLYQKVLNSINGTCQSFNLGSLYGTNLIMPCIDLNSYLGNSLWNTIDLIISGIFVLSIGRKMIKAFEGFTSMKEGDVIND